MIVLEVIPALESGGAQLSVLETVQALADVGDRALVASAGGRMVSRITSAGGIHLHLPLNTKNPLGVWRNAARLTQVIEAHHVDLVHAHSRAPAWSALLAAHHARVPFVTTWHGTYAETVPFKRYYNGVMAKGDRVIAVSHFIARAIAARHRITAPRVVVVPPGVDVARFDPETVAWERVHDLQRRWEIPDGHPVIMLPARMTPWKGHAVLLEALARMRRSDALCAFVGSVEGHERYVSRLRRLAATHGVAERVRFVGGCDAMPEAFMLADVVTNTSTAPEAFGRVVIEAQAMARPVVASAHGGAAETIASGKTGWLVPPSDPIALAATLDRLLAMDQGARQEIGRAARRAVVRSYSLSAMQSATVRIYRELLTAPRLDDAALSSVSVQDGSREPPS